MTPKELLPHVTHMGICHPKGYAFVPFGPKMGIDLAHFGLESVWFSREVRQCMNIFIISIPSEWERTD